MIHCLPSTASHPGLLTLAANNKLQIVSSTFKINKFQSNRCSHRKVTNSSLIPTNTRHLHHHQTLPTRPAFLCRKIKIQQTIYSHLLTTPPLLLLLLLSWGTLGPARSVTPCVSLPYRRYSPCRCVLSKSDGTWWLTVTGILGYATTSAVWSVCEAWVEGSLPFPFPLYSLAGMGQP